MVFARAGVHIFNGDGTGTNLATTSVNGVITVTDNLSDLTYTVNEDCTGTFKVLSIPIPGPTAEMLIAPNGEQMVVSNGSRQIHESFHSSSRRDQPNPSPLRPALTTGRSHRSENTDR
jgi:hypothetical protein